MLSDGEAGTPGFALIGCSETVQIMLSRQSQGQPGMWIQLDVDNRDHLEALARKWKGNGARIKSPLAAMPWGNVEMQVQDLDGHVFRVSAPI